MNDEYESFPSRGPWPQHDYTDGDFSVNFLLLTGLLGLLVSGLAGSPHSWEVLVHLPNFFQALGAQSNPIKTCTKVIQFKNYSLVLWSPATQRPLLRSTTVPATDIKPFPTKLFQLLVKSLDSFPCAPEMLGPKWDFSAQLQRKWEWLCPHKIQHLTASMFLYWHNCTTAVKPLCYSS